MSQPKEGNLTFPAIRNVKTNFFDQYTLIIKQLRQNSLTLNYFIHNLSIKRDIIAHNSFYSKKTTNK